MKTNTQLYEKINELIARAQDASLSVADRKVAQAQAYALNWARNSKRDQSDEPIEWGHICAHEIHNAYVPKVTTLDKLFEEQEKQS